MNKRDMLCHFIQIKLEIMPLPAQPFRCFPYPG